MILSIRKGYRFVWSANIYSQGQYLISNDGGTLIDASEMFYHVEISCTRDFGIEGNLMIQRYGLSEYTSTTMSTRDLSKMTVVQLREQLRSRGLPTDGTKAALIERLKGSYAVEDTILNSDASASKDILEETVLEGAINEDDILGPDISAKKKIGSCFV
ncbi:SAP domain protein [Onchocerca flexuosa]|uniref:SAP domain protein n=1 Tax=Onchocerca flexuosa TaxID=387005 RepID=A0A238BY32_9BILA|nr:SAP domain protein [Onchocerca flexuosa]